MKIITGNANPDLAQAIAEHCFATLVPAKVTTFADGESSVEFLENIRGEDVFQSGTPESFNVLIKEIRALGLNIELSNTN